MSATILIVENHAYLRQSLRGWLEAMFPDCQIIEATSGEEAVAKIPARTGSYVVVTAIGLPGMNGLETTARIKATAPATPVVVLTTYEQENELYRAHNSTRNGADAYVSKERMLTELQPTLVALLSPRNELASPRQK